MPDNEELLNEDALFDDAVEGTDSTPEATPETLPPEQAATPDAETVAKTSDGADDDLDVEDDSPVPSGRFRQAQEAKRAARAERDALRQERDRLLGEQQEFRRWMMSQQQKPAAPVEQPKQPDIPDPLLDPVGHADFLEKRWQERERRFEERLANERREISLQTARKTYKRDFDEAYAAATEHVDPYLRARMQQSVDPGETLMEWYRELKVRAEVGTDLSAYEQKVRQKLLKDVEFRKEFTASLRSEATMSGLNGRPRAQLAPSLNGVSRSNAVVRASQEDFSDDDLWNQTTT